MPIIAVVLAVYMLCFSMNVSQQARQPCLQMQVRPDRNYGRCRRRASKYGTQFLGRIRTEAWGPTFKPVLAPIAEEPFDRKPRFQSTLDTIAEAPVGPLSLLSQDPDASAGHAMPPVSFVPASQPVSHPGRVRLVPFRLTEPPLYPKKNSSCSGIRQKRKASGKTLEHEPNPKRVRTTRMPI